MIKKLTYIIILSLIFSNYAVADLMEAEIRYGEVDYEFKQGDEQKFLKNAKVDMLLFQNAKTAQERVYYLQDAMHYYFMVEKINNASIEAQIGLARINDELNIDKVAKRHFYKALNLAPQNPDVNMYFANYYYKRDDLINALKYYKRAYDFGYNNNFFVNEMLGKVYEKLADIQNAKKYYGFAFIMNTKDAFLANKIRLLDELNYSQSQYYLFKR